MTRSSSGTLAAALLVALGNIACASEALENAEETASTEESIYQGTTSTSPGRGQVVLHWNNVPGPSGFICSGTLLTNGWVLTASHCLVDWSVNPPIKTAPTAVMVGYESPIGTRTWRQATELHVSDASPPHDGALLRLASKMPVNFSTSGFTNTLMTKPDSFMYGKDVLCYGYGGNAWSTCNGQPCAVGADTLRHATLTLQPGDILPGYFFTFPNAQGQQSFLGDSGTSCTYTDGSFTYIAAAALSTGNAPPNQPPVWERWESANNLRDWIDQKTIRPGESLNGWTASRPAVAYTPTSSTEHVFVRGTDDQVFTNTGSVNSTGTPEVSGWTGWSSLSGWTTAGPAAVASGDTVYVFVRATNNSLRYRSKVGTNAWSAWENLSGVLTSGPGAAIRSGANSATWVFVRGTDGNIQYRMRSTGSWGGWTNIGGADVGVSTAEPAAIYTDNKVHVIVQLNDGSAAVKTYDSTTNTWGTTWTNLGKPTGSSIASGLAAASTAVGRIDLFAKNQANQLVQKKFYADTWASTWTTLLAGQHTLAASPGAVGRGNVIDVVTATSGAGLVSRMQTPY